MFFCGAPYTAAGTSAATPLWAGLIARINSYQPNPFGNIGWVNPLLYDFALGMSLFNPLNCGVIRTIRTLPVVPQTTDITESRVTPRLHSGMRARDGAAPMVRPFSTCLVFFFEKDRCALRQQPSARRFLVNGPVPHERSTK